MTKVSVAAISIILAMLALAVAFGYENSRKVSDFRALLKEWGVDSAVVAESVERGSMFDYLQMKAVVRPRPGFEIRSLGKLVRCPTEAVEKIDTNEYSCYMGDWGLYVRDIGGGRWEVSATTRL